MKFKYPKDLNTRETRWINNPLLPTEGLLGRMNKITNQDNTHSNTLRTQIMEYVLFDNAKNSH